MRSNNKRKNVLDIPRLTKFTFTINLFLMQVDNKFTPMIKTPKLFCCSKIGEVRIHLKNKRCVFINYVSEVSNVFI